MVLKGTRRFSLWPFAYFRGYIMKYTFLGKEISGCFTIPSGIITTDIRVLERIAHEIPEIGVLTTKSTGPIPRKGHKEPIFTQYAPGCFMNAVGLTNPGAEVFAGQLASLSLPEDRFLLVSIFGGTIQEYVKVAKTLAPYADGLELNLSCPNAKGFGMAVGQDPVLVREITQAVKEAVSIPIVPKLTPNVPDIKEIAKAAVSGGADALCAINSVGPGYHTVDGHPVLTNTYGGMCGKGILAIGLKSIREITDCVDVPTIACGGINSAQDVKAYQHAGAEIFGIGTSLSGLSTEKLHVFFSALQRDIEQDTDEAVTFIDTPDLSFRKLRLLENQKQADDLSILRFDRDISILPGQFVFIWLPGIGEKPFSVLDDRPLTLSIQRRGCFSEKLCQLDPGAQVYVRGPYGIPVYPQEQQKSMLVCGGCGLAALYHLAKTVSDVEIFMGAKDAQHLFYVEEARQVANVHIATEDGSVGRKGLVTELLNQQLQMQDSKEDLVFFNCGPKGMIEVVTAIEEQYAPRRNIYNSIDYVTKCGVGICGSCATPDGRRLCVDGPFM